MKIVGAFLDSLWQCTYCLGILGVDLCNKSCFDVYEAGNGYKIQVHKVEPILVDWS